MKSKLIIVTTISFIVIISICMTILNSDEIQREISKSKVYDESKR